MRMRSRSASLMAVFAVLAAAAAAPGPTRGGEAAELDCRVTGEGVATLLASRALQAVGVPREPGRALRWRAHRATLQAFQSDRSYPPFFSSFTVQEAWLDPTTGAERTLSLGGAYPGMAIPGGGFPSLATDRGEWIWRGSSWVASRDRSASAFARPIDPWAVLVDFAGSRDLRVTGRCRYRDYERVALERDGPYGAETLLLDPKTWVPVALVRDEPHFLWGDARADYVWSNWEPVGGEVGGGGLFPLTAFRTVRVSGVGESDPAYAATELSVTITGATLLPIDSAPPLAIPDTALRLPPANAAFWRPEPPDTVRVSPKGVLLVNRFYTTVALLERDTVFLLDATLSEARARQDSALIAGALPGRHPIVLVVTDLAWPHIGGVRFWVANGATVVAHRAAEGFLRRVVERGWTSGPDRLERERASATFRFRAVDDSLVLAAGAIRVHAIDGAATEGALLVWVPESRFLWPGDYIQNVREPSGYAREVLRATRRVGIRPERFAAQHVPLTPWRVIDSLHPGEASMAVSPAAIDPRRLAMGRIVRFGSVTHQGTTRETGERPQILSRTRYRGRDAIVSVMEISTPFGPAVDSSIADATTLAPIRHVGVHRVRTMVLDFDGARVTGRYVPETGPVLPIHQSSEVRPYDSSLYDLVIASLPLADGYRARIPVYVYEQGGLVWYDATVTGTEALALHDGSRIDAWRVHVTEEGELRSVVWISRSGPREVLRTTAYFGGAEATTTR